MVSESLRATIATLLVNWGDWGIGDDFDRASKLDESDTDSLRRLVAAVDALPDSVWDWLAGPEAESANPSEEYICVTDITMAADVARIRLKRLQS
jgi:hypothetical protein